MLFILDEYFTGVLTGLDYAAIRQLKKSNHGMGGDSVFSFIVLKGFEVFSFAAKEFCLIIVNERNVRCL